MNRGAHREKRGFRRRFGKAGGSADLVWWFSDVATTQKSTSTAGEPSSRRTPASMAVTAGASEMGGESNQMRANRWLFDDEPNRLTGSVSTCEVALRAKGEAADHQPLFVI